MFKLPVMLFVMGIMALIQMAVWQIFPVKFRDILFSNPILAFVVNLLGSSLILTFTGTASFVGICNLGASVLFGIWVVIYKKNKGIEGLEIKWKLLLPSITVKYK